MKPSAPSPKPARSGRIHRAAPSSTPVSVANKRILGLGDLTTGFSTTLNKTKFKSIYKRIRVTKGKGVSDHLPIAADITI